MIRSMTAFGRAESSQIKGGWSVEMRSVNHRYLELSLKIPPSLYSLEDRIREFCQSHIKRGKVTVNIAGRNESGLEKVTLDEKVLQFYLSAIRKVQRRFNLKGTLSPSEILTLPKIFSVDQKNESPEKIWAAVKVTLNKALSHFYESRVREGRALYADILGRIGKIEKTLGELEEKSKDLPKVYAEKLTERVNKLFEDRTIDQERIWQEAVMLSQRSDTTEEAVRLKSHLKLFRDKMAKGGEVGKELDFILQEMNRETNTLGAKSQDFEISKEVVSIKAELEKIREQVQNIE